MKKTDKRNRYKRYLKRMEGRENEPAPQREDLRPTEGRWCVTSEEKCEIGGLFSRLHTLVHDMQIYLMAMPEDDRKRIIAEADVVANKISEAMDGEGTASLLGLMGVLKVHDEQYVNKLRERGHLP